MFKKIFLTLALIASISVAGFASMADSWVLMDQSSIITSANYTQNLQMGRQVDYLSFQAVYSTEAYAAVTFIDGVPSTGTITVAGMTVGSTITVNGIPFVEGQNFNRDVLKTSGTATSLYNALSSTPLLSGIINFSLTATESVIYATGSIVGINYTLASSTPTAVTVAGMTGGIASDINYVSNTITKSNSFITGLAVIFSTTPAYGGYMGLEDGTTYFAIPTLTTIKLATTKANAIAGTAIDISSITANIGWATYTLTPALTGTSGNGFAFKWQVSNDNLNWYDSTASSVTISAATAPTNYWWDFGFTTFKYIRCALTSGAFGSIKLKLIGYGKRVSP